MGQRPPWKDIPDTKVVPADAYSFTVKSMEETMSKGSDDAKPKLMYTVALKIDEPKAFRGLQLFDRFVIGSEDDPKAEDPDTWKANGRRLKEFVMALKVTIRDDDEMSDTMEAAEGQKAVAMVTIQPRRKDPKTGREYNESNQITGYYALGDTPTVGASRPASPAAPASPNRKRHVEAAPASATTGTVRPKKVARAETTTCPICGDEAVPRSEFIAHVNAHSEQEATE